MDHLFRLPTDAVVVVAMEAMVAVVTEAVAMEPWVRWRR
jgi:hypothetical protein